MGDKLVKTIYTTGAFLHPTKDNFGKEIWAWNVVEFVDAGLPGLAMVEVVEIAGAALPGLAIVEVIDAALQGLAMMKLLKLLVVGYWGMR